MTQQVDKTRKLGLVNERVFLVDELSVFELGNDGSGSSGGEDLWLGIDVLKACYSKIRIRNRRQTTVFLKQHICKKILNTGVLFYQLILDMQQELTLIYVSLKRLSSRGFWVAQ